MARSKRLNRAEARRRYRAAQAATGEEGLDEALDEAPSASGRGARPGRQPAPAPRRMGFMETFRAASRPLDLRGDLAYLPRLLLNPRAVWLPIALIAVGFAVRLATPDDDQGIPFLVFQLLAYSPPVLPAFVAGFFAPRASYLAGLVVGIVGTLAFATLALSRPELLVPPAEIPESEATAFVISSLLVSGSVTALYSTAAAWYRRFLAISSAARRQMQGGRQKPAARRR